MPKITAIKKQLKNPDRFSVFVDEKYRFSFDQSGLLENKIKIGAEFDSSQIKNLEKKSIENKIFDLAYKKALRRQHSTKEMERYLYKKDLEQDAINLIISRLKKINVLNDQEFAVTYARYLAKKYSTIDVKSRLYKKGLPRKTVDYALANIEIDQKDTLEKLVDKKSKQSRYKDKQKLTEYLLRKGFNYSDIQAVFAKKEDL